MRVNRVWSRVAGVLAIVAAVSVSSCSAPAAEASATRAVAPVADDLLYVCNQNDATVSVIDMATNRVIRTVDLKQLGFSANARPHHVAVEPDGSFWYVTLIGDNRVVQMWRMAQEQAQFALRRAEIGRWNATHPRVKRGLAITPWPSLTQAPASRPLNRSFQSIRRTATLLAGTVSGIIPRFVL